LGSACFWSAALICGWSLSGQSRHPRVLRALLGAVCIPLVIAIVQAPFAATSILQDNAFAQDMVANGLLQGLVDEDAIKATYTDPAWVREVAPLLKARGMSVFASKHARLLGQPLTDAGDVETQACLGSFDIALTAPDLGPKAVRVKGSAAVEHAMPSATR